MQVLIYQLWSFAPIPGTWLYLLGILEFSLFMVYIFQSENSLSMFRMNIANVAHKSIIAYPANYELVIISNQKDIANLQVVTSGAQCFVSCHRSMARLQSDISRCGEWLRMYWMRNCGQPTRGGPRAWGFGRLAVFGIWSVSLKTVSREFG